MEVRYQRCAGLDVHKKSVVACVITPQGQQTRTFGTMTKDLLLLAHWLGLCRVTHVAMESTGVYWQPVFNVLEAEGFHLLVVNALHIKHVPGRKTDVKDAQWIADLLCHGLLRASFIPDRAQRELRELVRHRRSLIRERVRVVNRIQKVLEAGNIKLASVASDVVGISGRAMLEAMIAGTDDPKRLATLARGRMKAKRPSLEEALWGVLGPHQRFLLAGHLRHLDFLAGEITQADQEVAERLRPSEDALQRLDTIPGIGRRTAEEILAEVGLDMHRWPTVNHFASWLKLCPGNNESGGRIRRAPTGHGNQWLRATFIEAARAAARTKHTHLASQYRRLSARRGASRAAVALAHSIARIVYFLLLRGDTYRDLGGDYLDERDRQATLRRAVNRIQQLGYKVTVEAA